MGHGPWVMGSWEFYSLNLPIDFHFLNDWFLNFAWSTLEQAQNSERGLAHCG
jgi:hypothetical protein